MNIKITESNPDELAFIVQNTDSSFANALRRVILSEIPTLAIDEVTVRSNSSVTKDEMLVHRLGLVPIVSNAAKEMNFPWACPCKERKAGCSRCTVEMELSVRCDLNQSVKQITTNDISVIHGPLSDKVYPAGSQSKAARGIWLTSIGPGQEINLYCKVHKGIAKQHAKWMPVSAVRMQYEADIRLNRGVIAKLPLEMHQKLVDTCPVKVFGLRGVETSVSVDHPENCIFCEDCTRAEGLPPNIVRVHPKKTSENRYNYRFYIEAIGSLTPEAVLREGLHILRTKLDVIDGLLNGQKILSFTQQSLAPGEGLVNVNQEKNAEASCCSLAETEVMSVYENE